MKEEIKNHWSKWIFFVTVGIVLIIVYKAIDSIGFLGVWISNFVKVITPFLSGLLLAYLLYIPERKIENTFREINKKGIQKRARGLGIFTTYIILALIVLISINVILPVLVRSINELVGNIPGYYNKVIEEYNALPSDSIFKTEQISSTLKEIQNFDLKQYLSIDRVTGYVKSAVGVASSIFDIFVSIIVSIYILAERNEILEFLKKFCKALFKEKTYEYIERYFYRSNGIFFKFLTSQFVDAIVVGLLTSMAMSMLKIKYSILLGFMIGLFNMIPYFGAIVAVVIAGIITIITSGFSKALVMLIVVIILQQIDANIINPKIVGDSLRISPLIVILSVTIGGAYFGIIGMFLAVPIAAVLKIVVNDYIDNKLLM